MRKQLHKTYGSRAENISPAFYSFARTCAAIFLSCIKNQVNWAPALLLPGYEIPTAIAVWIRRTKAKFYTLCDFFIYFILIFFYSSRFCAL